MARRLTNEEFKKRASGFIDWSKFELEVKYSGTRKPISVVCLNCEFERFYNKAQYLLDYTGEYSCESCGKRKKMSPKELIDFAYENRHRGTLEVIGDYSGVKRTDDVEAMCTECGDRKHVQVSSYIAGKAGCRICSDSEQFTTECVSQKIKDLTDGEYELVGDYVNSQVSIEIMHNSERCNFNTWETGYGNFVRQNRRCPKCTFVKSKGEQGVENYLKNSGVVYEEQYRFDDCRNAKPLPFDFAIIEDGLVVGLIEYDGKQHYEASTGIWANSEREAEMNLLVTQRNDAIKEKYCLENDIPLLVIPYWDFNNIEEFLEEFLSDIKSSKQVKL